MSALAILAVVALTMLVACAVLAQIPYGTEDPVSEEPIPEGSPDEAAQPHRDYLILRGWHVDEELESGRPGAPVVAAWSRAEDGLGPHTFADALLLQLTEDVERLGGYEPFVSMCDVSERGVER